jgi:hypothetical protein
VQSYPLTMDMYDILMCRELMVDMINC